VIEHLIACTANTVPLVLIVHCDYCGAAIVNSIACGLCRECAKREAAKAERRYLRIAQRAERKAG
jgi:hypothetical protein